MKIYIKCDKCFTEEKISPKYLKIPSGWEEVDNKLFCFKCVDSEIAKKSMIEMKKEHFDNPVFS